MIPIKRLEEALAAETVVLLSDDNRDGAPDAGVLEAALNAAEAEALHELSRAGYPPPDVDGAFLEQLIVTLAVEKLYMRRREMMPGSWAERAHHARTILRDVGDGRRSMPGIKRNPRIDTTNDDTPVHRDDILGEY